MFDSSKVSHLQLNYLFNGKWKLSKKKNITDSAVPLNSMEHFSVLQPIVLGHVPFTTLVTFLLSIRKKAVKQEWAETKPELQEATYWIYIVRWAETLPLINANIRQCLLDL